jgi:predicted nucleic acid-binding protein
MTELVVADTTVWCNFAHAGQPRLVPGAYPGVTSPQQVLDEIAEGQRLGHLGDFDWRFIQRVQLTRDEEKSAERLQEGTLGRGEAACLAVAAARGVVVLTDDRDARTIAGALGVQVSGTLGVLLHLVDMGAVSLTEADGFLVEMIRAGYRSPVASLTELA